MFTQLRPATMVRLGLSSARSRMLPRPHGGLQKQVKNHVPKPLERAQMAMILHVFWGPFEDLAKAPSTRLKSRQSPRAHDAVLRLGSLQVFQVGFATTRAVNLLYPLTLRLKPPLLQLPS